MANGQQKQTPRGNQPQVRMFRINLNSIFTFAIIALVALVAFTYFSNKQTNAKEVSVSEFVTNIKTNSYSLVEIKDDGTATAKSKYILTAELVNGSDVTENTKTPIFKQKDNEFQEITLDQFYDLIRPLSFDELVKNITNPGSVSRTSNVYVAEALIIAENSSPSGKDFIVKSGEKDLLALLQQKGLTLDSLAVNFSFLRTASGEKNLQDFKTMYDAGSFSRVWEYGTSVIGKLNETEIAQQYVYWAPLQTNFSEFLQREGIKFDATNIEFRSTVVPQIPWGDLITIAILVGFGFLAFLMLRGIQGSGSNLMRFGQSKARLLFGQRPDVTFKDVAGVDEAKEELREVVLFLKDPKRFLKMGARIPKGLLMVGAPGTGKTLLARAIAGEAGVPFFHTSGSEFEEMLVGAGASRVRDLFDKAKKAAPSIIFIDEIDAVARKRGTTVQSSTTEQTLNQILVEMDGFEKNVNVIVIAATNRPDVLDPAILRPGRFDRRVVLDLPDIEGRKQILKLHASNKPLAKDVDLEKLARRTVGFSGADIENMLNEAAIIVAKENRNEIVFGDLEEAANKVQMGPAKKRKRTDEELKMTAYHEAGHALVMKLTPQHDPVHRVTIVSRGMALGYTMPLPETDQTQMTKTQMLSKIKALVAGYVTEELVFGDVTSGASNDIEKATSLARRMVKSFGMSTKLGLVKYGTENELQYLGYGYGEQRDYSEESARFIDEEVRRIMQECYKDAQKIITENREILDRLVKSLLEKEVLESDEFNAFFKEKPKKK